MSTPLPRPLLGVLFASALLVAASPAQAEDAPRVFPLIATSPLPPEQSGAADALTAALADLLDGEALDATLEDIARRLRCDVETSSCLDAIARSLKTSQIVYGTFAAAPERKLKVKLVRFDSSKSGSELHTRTFVLTARTPKRLGKQLARSAAQMFDRAVQEADPDVQQDRRALGASTKPAKPEPRDAKERTEPTERTEPKERTEPTEPTEPGPLDVQPPGTNDLSTDAPASGGITKTTWGLIGGGAVGGAVGIGFLLSARSLQSDLAAAPRKTTLDFQRLTQIERAGRIRTQIGGALTIAGGAVLAVGVVRAVIQRGGRSTSLERSIALVPVEGGGAAVLFSGGLR